MTRPLPTPDEASPAPGGDELLARLRRLVFLGWSIPPVVGLGFTVLIGVLTPRQLAAILLTPLEPVYILGWLAFALWFLPRSLQPAAAWLDNRGSEEAALAAVRRFPLVFWATFLVYLVLAPVSVLVAADLYTDYVPSALDAFRIGLVAVCVSIVVGLPIFFRILDLFGRLLGGLALKRPVVGLRTRVILIGVLIPLLIDTLLVLYYWTRTGFFSGETFWVWLSLELLAVAGSLLFAHSFGQSLAPLAGLLGRGNEAPPAALRARSTDELGVLTADFRALIETLQTRSALLNLNNRLLRAAGSAAASTELLAAVADLCREALGSDTAFVVLREAESGDLKAVAEAGKGYREQGHWRLKGDEPSITRSCLEAGETLALAEVEGDARTSQRLRLALDTRSVLATPIRGADGLMGALVASTHGRSRQWSAWDITLIENLAREAAVALHTLRMQEAREQAEARRREDAELVRVLMDATEEGIYGGDPEGRCLFINRAALRMLGYERPEEVLGRKLHSLIHHTHPDGRPYPEEECRVRLASLAGLPAHSDEEVHWRKDGTSFPVEYWSHPIHRDGKLIGTVVSFVDITARKQAEAAEARRNRMLQTLAAATDLMLKSVGGARMMQDICDLLVEKGGFSMAWIGMVGAERRVIPVASAGFHADYLARADVRADDSVRARGPVGTAIREQRTVITDDTETDPAFAPWRELARENGFRSVLATPVRVEGEVVGSLAVYAGQPRAFGIHEITLAQRLAADLGQVLAREAADASLRASEARLEEAQAMAHLGSWELDLESGVAIWSAEEYRLLGYEPGGVAPGLEAFMASVHPADRERVRQAMEASVAQPDGGYRVEHRVRGPDGRTRILLEIGRTEFDGQGRPRRMVGTSLDVTELRTIADALQETELRLHHVVTSTPIILFALDREGVFTLSEGAGLARLGLTPGQVVGKSVFELYPDPEIQGHVRRALAGEAFVAHARVGRRYYEVHYQPVLDEHGGVESVVGVALDDTERTLAEQELERYRARLEELVAERTREVQEQATIIDQIHDAVVRTDLDGIITGWNAGAERLFGYRAEEAVGRPVAMVHLDPTFLEQGIIAPLKAKGAHEVEVTMRRKDGSLFDGHLSLSLLRDAEGQPVGMVGYTIDITPRREAERLLKARSEQLAALNRELEAFSYSVSHDLRAPLRAIDGFSQALLEDYGDRLDATGHDYLQRIRGGAQRMARLIDDLLNLSRVTRSPLNRAVVDLSALAEEIVAELRASAPERNVTVDIQPGLTGMGDPALLRLALANLLDNAWKYTGRTENPSIRFGAETQDGETVYFVRDNGAGFDMKYADKLFGAFQRLHHPSEFEGTGVGLATVQRVIHRHGGRIWADAEPGRGAVFRFTLGPASSGKGAEQ